MSGTERLLRELIATPSVNPAFLPAHDPVGGEARVSELLEAALGKKARLDYKALQPGDVPLTCADISKARAKLGYNPSVQIARGIALFIDWLRRNANK